MARAAVAATLAATASFVLAGCGTMANMSDDYGPGDRKIFGGVQLDVSQGTGYAACAARSDGPVRPIMAGFTACEMAADVPFSLVADTLTLPWTVLAPAKKPAQKRQKQDAEERTSKAADDTGQDE
jgi:uncharacterized protein YceK